MTAPATSITIENITITAPAHTITIDGQQPETLTSSHWHWISALDRKCTDLLDTTNRDMPYHVHACIEDIHHHIGQTIERLQWCSGLPDEVDAGLGYLNEGIQSHARQALDFAHDCEETHRLESIGPVYDDDDDFGKDFMTDAESNLVACQGTDAEYELEDRMIEVQTLVESFLEICTEYK